MTKKHIHEIICPACGSSFWVNDTYSYFNNQQKCSNCNSVIQTGSNGLNEQILIQIKRKASVRTIRMVKDARNCSMRDAKKLVKKIAKENSIKIDTDVTPVLNFFMRIIFSGLLGLAVVGIGSIYYPNLQKIAAPVVCRGEFNIEIKERLKTKTEGERSEGAVIVATCDDEDISKETFYASVGIYSLIIFILLSIRKLFKS
jgi:RNA-binding protein YhbY